MNEIPLFPLNTVVFPGWPMPLNIFESRYKEMIEYCVSQKQPFGIVLVQEGEAEFDTAVVPHTVGCVVEITKVQRVEDGRLYILAVGQERFRIRKLKRDKPYLVGVVDPLEFLEEEGDVLDTAVFNLRPLVIQYFSALANVEIDAGFDTSQIPSDPEELGFLAASILQISVEAKQSMLEARKASNLLNYLTDIYERELKVIPREDMGNFSPN